MTLDLPPSKPENVLSPTMLRIEDWKSRLIDLSRRNNLLYFRQTKRGNLPISHPNPETIFNALVLRKRRLEFWVPPDEKTKGLESQTNDDFSITQKSRPGATQLVSDDIGRADLVRVLKNLYRRSLSDYRERGVRILQAAFGMLVWKEKETSEEVHSPLLLVPIELSRETFRKPFSISVPPVEEEVVLNPALQVKLKNDFKIELPPLPEDLDSQSLTNYFAAVTRLVEELGWKLKVSTQIGLFSFYKLVIYNDLNTNATLIRQHPIVRAVAGVKDSELVREGLPEEKDVDTIQPPDRTFQVLDADSSQRISIEYALRGQSFVMQGPPGTGKSQTIANIIAECIAQGKSVLFVSEKMAALEVVYKRLREVGLSQFCLELHSSKANKQEVVAELKRCLDEHLVPRAVPSQHDFEKMMTLRDDLNNYVASLHQKRSDLQKSAFEVLGIISSLENVPFIPVELPNPGELTPQRMNELETMVAHLKNDWQVMEEQDFPWRGFRGNVYSMEIRSELTTVLDNLLSTVDKLRLESARYAIQMGLENPSTFERVKWLIEISKFILESPKPEASWVTNSNLDQLIVEAENHKATIEWCKATRSRLSERYNDSIYSLPLDRSAEVTDALSAVNKLIRQLHPEESDLLKKREKTLTFARKAQTRSERWTETSHQLAQILGLSEELPTLVSVRRLARFALFCLSDTKPEAQWLDPAYLQQVAEVVANSKKDYREHNSLRNKLLETYDEKILDLDLEALTKRYGEEYQSSLRWFRPSFHRDQKLIASLTRWGKVPDSVLKDLQDTQRLKTLRVEIAASAERVQSLLGHYYQGYETDFQRVEEAMSVASEVRNLLGSAPVPSNVVGMISYGSTAPPVVKQVGNELRESLAEWNQLATDLNGIMPQQSLPNSGLPINETPLLQLREWAKTLEKQLVVLRDLTNETLVACKSEEPQNYKQLIENLKDAETVRKKEAALLEVSTMLREKFGLRFNGLETDWREILSVLAWTKQLQALVGRFPMPEELGQIASKGTEYAPSNEALIKYDETSRKGLEDFESRFESDPTQKALKLHEGSLEAAHDKVKCLRERVDDLQIWVDFKELKNLFLLKGLSGFFDRLASNVPAASRLVDIFRRGAYQEWINYLYDQDPHLGKFRRENHEQLIEEFRRLDQDLIRLSSNRAMEEANERKPQDILIQADDSEVNTLLKEALKKRRLMPIRNLLQKIPHVLFKLKPCSLMSPISVSQFLPAELSKFDLILFDEASQIVPEDAIGSIYRGKTTVVAGDNKQLPPTSFFQKSLLEDVDWDEIGDEYFEVFDSILDECLGIGLPVKTLRWHYRSKHEELIAFSNNRFYDGSLVTFPSAIAKDETLGVKLVFVPDGVYDRGGRRDNPREAEVVAELVFEHFRQYPKKTLGVVTFSLAQMETVEEAIERRLRSQPEYEHFFKEDRLEGFFVKNLENVQGDERDVMIVSVGYGYDYNGQLTMNFGPVNKPGGERRLNVVITRAREKSVLVTSIKSSDIDPKAASSAGVMTLRGYLEYAGKGPEILKSTRRKAGELESALEEDVARVVQEMGYSVVPKVGCSDYPIGMGVVDPAHSDSFLLGIEFDGTTYRSSNSARDRDRLREQVLRQLGWRIHRIWSPSWVARRESEMRRLKDAIEESSRLQMQRAKPVETPIPEGQETEPTNQVDVKKLQFAGLEKIGVPYKVHPLEVKCDPYIRVLVSRHKWVVRANEFRFPENRQLQSRLLEELVKEEGPVHFDYAVQRIASAWGLKRTGPKIVQAVREALHILLQNRRVVVKGSFIWPAGVEEVQARVPVAGVPESKRVPEHIPPEEIAAALKLIAQYALGVSPESLVTETSRLFGFNHTGSKIEERISEIYRELLRERKLIHANGVVTVP